MKHLRKIMALVLSLAMVLAMSITAFATEGTTTTTPGTFTITAPAGEHQYEIYQIFTGDLSNGTLSNIKWGANGTGTQGTAVDQGTLDALTALNTTETTDTAKLATISTYVNLTSPLVTIGGKDGETVNHTSYEAAAGYYLIKDKDTTVSGNDSYTKYLVKVVGDLTIEPKSAVPSFEKKIKDTNDTTGETTGWQDSADYDIGDEIPYQLTATMGDLSSYKTYYVKFHDTMTHLTFKEITTVKVGETVLRENQYTANWDAASKKLTVAIDNVKAYGAAKGTNVVVEYKATLDEDAVIGSAGNPNTAYLEYSNNPNNAGAGETGKTPEDKNIVFTYKTVVNKVDQDGKSLEGARFELFKEVNGEWISKGTPEAKANVEDNKNNVFEWSGLDDGKYKLVETVTPNEYNTIQPIEFTISAKHEAAADDPKLISLAGGDKFTGNVSNGTLTTAIENKLGSTLPETGGIGTTVFYVVGVILMLGAGVLLVTKKRMSSNR